MVICGSDILRKPYSSRLIKTQKSDRRNRPLAGLGPQEARFPHAGIITMLELTSAKKTSTALRFSIFRDLTAIFFLKPPKTNGKLPLPKGKAKRELWAVSGRGRAVHGLR